MKTRQIFPIILLLVTLLPLTVTAQSDDDPPFRVEIVVSQADFPVAMAFAPDGTLFYTEKMTGWIRRIDPETGLQGTPVIDLDVDFNVELGLLGIAVDPDYTENQMIWATYIQPNTVEPPTPVWKLIRIRLEDGIAVEGVQMLSVPIVTREQHHVGGNIRFDEEGRLYASIGDMGNPAFSQDINAMQGRIHRFVVDGDQLIPDPDNPFDDNSTFAYGLRNPFDFDFDVLTPDIISGENGPACDDELNLVFPGGNYGWRPDYPCDDKAPQSLDRFVYPLKFFTPTEGLTGVLVYDGEMFPEWYGDIFFCGWNQGILRRMVTDDDRFLVESITDIQTGFRCATDVEVGLDGAIYFMDYGAIYRLVRDE